MTRAKGNHAFRSPTIMAAWPVRISGASGTQCVHACVAMRDLRGLCDGMMKDSRGRP